MSAAALNTNTESPSVSSGITTLVLGGLAGLMVWEAFAHGVAPLWIGGPLEPAGLIQSVFGSGLVKGIIGDVGLTKSSAQFIHYLTGLVFYPLGFVLIARPLVHRLAPSMPWWITAAIYGAALWVFALYAMAHLIAGFPPFLGFGQLAWASLVGHIAYGLALGAIVNWRQPT